MNASQYADAEEFVWNGSSNYFKSNK